MKIKDKVALVLGAIKGIGKGIGLALAEEGAKVAFNYFDWEDSLVELQQDVAKTGQDHLLIKTDLLESEKIPELVKNVVDHFGRTRHSNQQHRTGRMAGGSWTVCSGTVGPGTGHHLGRKNMDV